jgi:release factor glutamine methyltransferase
MSDYFPKLNPERIEELRRWHEDTSAALHKLGAHDVEYLGLRLHVPEHVFPPTPTSDLLGREVLAHVQPGDRVLDMGCGAGANAILAARVTDHVVAVDVNPHAVAATSTNAELNGVATRVRCIESDVFEVVDGQFDVIVIDPPFRWFPPRDPLERAITDENYEALGRFFTGAARHLRPNGYVLLFFGTSGDVEHLDDLITTAGMKSHVVAERTINTRGQDTTYYVKRITKG